jgi:serine/threonine-protein kinase RsbW
MHTLLKPQTKDGSDGLREIFDLTIPADKEAIATLADAADAALARCAIPEQKRLEIGLALHEALANAIVHGCNNDPTKQVHCRCSCDPDQRVLVVVTDPGPGFPTDTFPDPKTESNLYAHHGRGVYLMRQLMDDLEFAGGGNQIRMWKY